jgi:hypothetical protein
VLTFVKVFICRVLCEVESVEGTAVLLVVLEMRNVAYTELRDTRSTIHATEGHLLST